MCRVPMQTMEYILDDMQEDEAFCVICWTKFDKPTTKEERDCSECGSDDSIMDRYELLRMYGGPYGIFLP